VLRSVCAALEEVSTKYLDCPEKVVSSICVVVIALVCLPFLLASAMYCLLTSGSDCVLTEPSRLRRVVNMPTLGRRTMMASWMPMDRGLWLAERGWDLTVALLPSECDILLGCLLSRMFNLTGWLVNVACLFELHALVQKAVR
jgi:hypothetical protein